MQDIAPSIQFDTKGVEFGPWLRRFIAQIRRNWFIPYAAMSMRGHVVVTFYVHKDGRITDLAILKPSDVDAFTHSGRNAIAASNPDHPAANRVPGRQGVLYRHLLLQRKSLVTWSWPNRTQQWGLILLLAALVALASFRSLCLRAAMRSMPCTWYRHSRSDGRGKSALGINLASASNGEIVSCDSTAVYRGFDIGTDKVPLEQSAAACPIT